MKCLFVVVVNTAYFIPIISHDSVVSFFKACISQRALVKLQSEEFNKQNKKTEAQYKCVSN